MTTRQRDKFPPKRYIFCNTCRQETNHFCEADCYRTALVHIGKDVGFNSAQGYRLWICAGCEEGTLERYYTDIGMDGEESSAYFPERTILHVTRKHFRKLPAKLREIYRETLQAYNSNLLVLCAMGIRALLEGICADKGIEGKDLEKRIENLKSILPGNIVSSLHSLRFIGNVAAHELTPPEPEDLRLAISICEDLLNFLYELDYKASRLNKARKAKEAKGKA